ncbi:fructose-bisphosphate aldolase, partial [Streptomyces sp. NPDC058291]
MPLTTTGELATRARAARSAVAAFNIVTLEHAEAVIAGGGCPYGFRQADGAGWGS